MKPSHMKQHTSRQLSHRRTVTEKKNERQRDRETRDLKLGEGNDITVLRTMPGCLLC